MTKDDGKPYGVHPLQPKVAQNPICHGLCGSALVGASAISSMARSARGTRCHRWRNVEACPELDDLVPPRNIKTEVLDAYGAKRDFPAIPGTSRLSLHLRFGTIGIRKPCEQDCSTAKNGRPS